MPIASSVALGWWAIVDARRAHRPIPVLGRPWFFFFAGLLVPGYVLWTRRWRGLAWLALCAVTWLVLATVVMNGGGAIAFGDQ